MAKMNNCVDIVEVCTVTLPPGSTATTSLPLTFFDISLLRIPPVKSIYFYKSSMPFDVVVLNLKTSLSLALQHYLPLAGAIVWPESASKPTVETLPGDGVELTIAKSNTHFSDLVGDGLHELEEFHSLAPGLLATESRAVAMALQLTSFGTHGFCIGIIAHHAIMDGRCATSFLKFWACQCKSLVAGTEPPTAEMMPLYDRSVVTDPAGLEGIYLTDWLALEGPNNRSLKYWTAIIEHKLFLGTFKLNPEDIEKLKQFVLKHSNPAHISTFTVALAYTWVCTAMSNNSFQDGKMVLSVTADVRRRLDPIVPHNYFGNCTVDRIVAIERNKLIEEKGVITAVECISKAIKSLEDGVLNGAEESVKMLSESKESNVKSLYIAGSPKFESYSFDFGWGATEKLVYALNGPEVVSISEGGRGGIEVAWVGNKGVMDTFAAVFAKGLQQL